MHTGSKGEKSMQTQLEQLSLSLCLTNHLSISIAYSRTEVRQQIRNFIDCVYASADSPRPNPKPEVPWASQDPHPEAGLWASSMATQRTRSTPSRTPSSAARMWTAKVGQASRYVSNTNTKK